jgi:hypothetical protein
MKLSNKLLQEGSNLVEKTWKEREDPPDSTVVDPGGCAKEQAAMLRDGLPAICFLVERNRYYWFNDHTGQWQRSTKGDIKLWLRQLRYDPVPILLRLQAEHVIDDVCEELGDLPAGIHVQNEKRILVMSGKGAV